ncbi:MAG: hypothetical protein HY669_04200 [Chloroflexi bacterium]|nr:hypothetical protein [Chloroflexota bacterium]
MAEFPELRLRRLRRSETLHRSGYLDHRPCLGIRVGAEAPWHIIPSLMQALVEHYTKT